MNPPPGANPPFIKLRNRALSAKKTSIYSLHTNYQQPANQKPSNEIEKQNISFQNLKNKKIKVIQQKHLNNSTDDSALTIKNAIYHQQNYQQKNIQKGKNFQSIIHQEMMDSFREEFQALRKQVFASQYSKSTLNNSIYKQINPVVRNPRQNQKGGYCSRNASPYNSFTHSVNSANKIQAKQKPQNFENPASNNSLKNQKRQTIKFGADKFYSQNPLYYVKSLQIINVAGERDLARNQPFYPTNPASNLFFSVNQKQKITKHDLKEVNLSTPKKYIERSTATISNRQLSTENNAQSFIQQLNEEPIEQDTTQRESKKFVRSFQKVGLKDQNIKETLAVLDTIQNKDRHFSQALHLIYRDASIGNNLLVYNKLLFVRNVAN